ncbi:hypothetical protein [Breoghania sp.]|uniref:hypothetical protein n=1 Tax=Breoghania sp. TaxID=2065378 RepID=UPI002AA854FF|nr:hypothetical protein [Breoghania sp.]
MITSQLENQKTVIENLVRKAERNIASCEIATVMQRRRVELPQDDYSGFSLQTEYYNDLEVDEVINSLRSIGIYSQHYFDENSFFNDFIRGELPISPRRRLFVYASGHPGTDRARKALIPLFCSLNSIGTLNSPAYAEAINRHKYHQYLIAAEAGLPMPESWYFRVGEGWLGERPPPGERVLAKPIGECASVGLDKNSLFEFGEASDVFLERRASELNQDFIVQEFVPGAELETAILNLPDRFALLPVAIRRKSAHRPDEEDWLDYQAIYNEDYSFADPDGVEAQIIEQVRALAVKAARYFEHGGISRIDMRICRRRGPLIIDISTTPHLVGHSSINYRFRTMGFQTPELFSALLATALDNNYGS